MKRVIVILTALVILLTSVVPVYAAGGQVTYDGNAKEFIFEPGSKHSVTDLFPNFKDVMPGDSINQRILVKNDVDNKVKVKIYMRSLGAHEDSVDFLSQMKLTVTLLTDTNLFDATADEKAQLEDWTYLGLLYSGGEAELDVQLDVPVTMGNEFQEQVGFLDWQFKVEEFPVEPDDPQPPETGDKSYVMVWIAAGIGALAILIIVVAVIVLLKNRKKDEE